MNKDIEDFKDEWRNKTTKKELYDTHFFKAIDVYGEIPGYLQEARYAWKHLHTDDDVTIHRYKNYLIMSHSDGDDLVIKLPTEEE
jgi:hypothetical protein